MARIADVCVSMSADDYLDLPPLVVADVPVLLDAAAQKAYTEMERHLVLEVAGQVVDAGTAAILRHKLLQLAGGSVYDDQGRPVHIHDCKLEAFLELVEALDGQHALVFYGFRHEQAAIAETLRKAGVNARELNGPADMDDWNAGKVEVLLAHPASCAYGLNLQQGGRHVIWYGLTDSLELYQQANARLHRQGQVGPVIVHRLLVQGGVDEDVAAGLERKDKAQEYLLEKMKARIEKYGR